LFFFSFSTFAQFAFQWDKTLGGSGADNLTSSISTNDGGYLLAGYSNSPASGDKSEDGNFSMDYWVVKIDSDGNKVWDKTFGAGSATYLRSLAATNDGGYLLGGHTVSNALRDKSEDSKGGDDYWIIKIDGNGNKVWDKTIGGGGTDRLYSMSSSPDGGFLLAGQSNSNVSADKSENRRGSYDYWVVKINENGNKIWDKTFGGNRSDDLQAVTITPDGGFLLGGSSITTASGDQSEDGYGGNDYWVIKIDENGNKVWDKIFGGNREEKLTSISIDPNGGYLLAGRSQSNASGNKSEDGRGSTDYWVVKIDEDGNKNWDKTFGGTSSDLLFSSSPTLDGGYLLAGYSPSRATGDKSEESKGGRDYWIVNIDGSGNKIWDKIFGGSSDDLLYSTTSTPKGDYLLAGNSGSNASGDKSEDSRGGLDYWVVKLQDVNADNEIPVIQELAPISANTEAGLCNASVAFSTIVTDNSDATITPVFSILVNGVSMEISSPYTFPIGETMVAVNAMDAAGNEAVEQTFTVTVEDNEAPVIEAVAPITVTVDAGTCAASVEFSTSTSDNCDASVSPVFSILVDGESTEIGSPYTFPIGETTIAVNAMDAAGNEAAEQSFTITVEDREAPVIETVAPITVTTEAGTCVASVELSATTSDNCDSSVSPVFSIQVDGVSTEISSPYTFPAGETTVAVNAMDAAGNAAVEQTFTVMVEDSEAPVIEPIAPITAISDSGTCTASVELSATTSDNCDSSVSPVYSILVDGVSTEISSPYTFPAGETTVAVNAMDASGNQAVEQTFTVNVEDNEAPVIEAVAPIVATVDAGSCAASVEFSTTVSDNCDATINPVFSIMVDGVNTEISSPYTFPAGETIVAVIAMDAAGNDAAEQTFTVTVEDREAPVIEPVAPITAIADAGTCAASVEFFATTTDNCDTTVSPVFSILVDGANTEISSLYTFPIGETTVAVNAMDAAGNEADEQTFTVTVTNNLPQINGTLTTLPVGPNPVGTTVTVSDRVTDNNIRSVEWHWNDGVVTTGSFIYDVASGTSNVSGQRSFNNAQNYTVTLVVTDHCNERVEFAYPNQIDIVDPIGGTSVRGRGWIRSLIGATVQYPDAKGKAKFSFDAKYQPGDIKPTGRTKFRFKAGNIDFKSLSYERLLIVGPTTMLRGDGTNNGFGLYGFLITAVNGKVNGDGLDKFRIKIWDKFNGLVIYDNEMGSSDDAEPNTVIGGGQIGTKNKKPGKKNPGNDKADKKKSGKGNLGKNKRINELNLAGKEIIVPNTKEPTTLNIKVYPNPFQEKLFIELQSNLDELVLISIFDLTGRLLYEEKWPIVRGSNKVIVRIDPIKIKTQKVLLRLMSPSTGFHNFILLKP
jgi:hypothetical protein